MHARRLVACFALALTSSTYGCVPGVGSEDSNAESSSEESAGETGADGPWLEFSQGCDAENWAPVRDGSELTVVLGGQGLLMIPMPLRAGGFDLPAEIFPFSPETPILEFEMRVPGHAYLPNGTFARIANYPVLFRANEGPDGEHEFIYLTVFVPDEIGANPSVVDGLPATVNWTLDVLGEDSISGELQLVLDVPTPLGTPPSCGFG